MVLDPKKYEEQLASAGFELFKAMSMGMKMPRNRQVPTDEDYQALGAKMQLLGVPSYFDLMAKEDVSNEKYCPALISLLSNATRLEGDLGDRIRADMAKSLAEE